ncbi:MAG: 5'-3' exonuclease [Oryzihumus sp.]
MTERLMLLDSASLYFRAFYGVPDRRRTPQEPPTNAVRGFLDMIATLVTTHAPTHLVACWDNDWRPAFRVAAIPTYKTHRLASGSDAVEDTPEDLVPQVPVIRDALQALGIARVGADGYEADDVIGTLTHLAGGRMPVDVVTGDRDLFQLVDDAAGVRVLYTARGGVRDADVVTQDFLRARYAVATGAAYADMATLRGDTSDGLPGVQGIGEKTAATLIARYGDLAGVRRALAEGDPQIKGAQRTRLEAASDYLDAAPTVVQVARDAPVGEVDGVLPGAVADPVLMSRLAADFGLAGSFNRVLAAFGIDG